MAQLAEALRYKPEVAGSIPDGLIRFVVELVLLVALWLWGALSL